jgi:hypothetical protein
MKLILEKEKKFQFTDQLIFAKISGDYNPIHLDRNYARRSISGDIAVHGINLVFWGLDTFLKFKKVKIKIIKINIIFSKFININQKVKIKIFQNNNKVLFNFFESDILAAQFEIQYLKSLTTQYSYFNKKFIKKKASVTKFENFKIGKKFVENFAIDNQLFKKKFLNIHKYLNFNQIIDLVTITRLVGMNVPGEDSILSKLDLFYKLNNVVKSEIKITSIDKRFSLINLYYVGKNLSGNIRTLMRPKKINQTIQNKKLKINKREFSKQRALIIGGSKGLGEATVKILSSGSAKILFSYFNGKKDAVQHRRGFEKNIKIFHLNIERELNSKISKNIKNFKPTHLYYFATPRIFTGNGYDFREKNFTTFNNYYISGFKKIFDLLDKKILQSVFFPSSVAINEATSKLCEYACSKAAQEILLKYLNEKYKKIYFSYPRLPRLKTDQTLSILDHSSQLPFRRLLNFVRKLR